MISGEIFFGVVIGLILINGLYNNPTALWALSVSFVVWIVFRRVTLLATIYQTIPRP